MTPKLNAAFLGGGYMSQTHAKNLLKFPSVTLTAVCDTSLENCATLKETAPTIKAYTDFDQMLASEEIDILYVCLPPFAHNGQVEKAAAKGIHMFLEKPIALTVERGESMVATAKNANIITHVGYHMRYSKPAQELKKLVTSGKAGKPVLFHGSWECNSLHSPWWMHKDKCGGQVFEQVIHLYDMAVNFLGECETVSGYAANLTHTNVEGYTIDDNSVAVLKFKNGGLANITGSNSAVPDEWKTSFTVVCENVTARFTSQTEAIFYFTDKQPVEQVLVTSDKDNETIPPGVSLSNEMYYNETVAFLNAIAGISQENVPIEIGLHTLKMVDAVCRSNGKLINIFN